MGNRSSRINKKFKGVISYTVSRYPARTYGERIRQKRLGMGLKQDDLAKLLSSNKTSVLNWEKDKHVPSPASRGRIRDILGVDDPVVPVALVDRS